MKKAETRRQKEVYKACNALWAENPKKIPTQKAIEKWLVDNDYAAGSPNQIYDYRAEWVENNNIKVHQGEPRAEEEEALIKSVTEVYMEKFRKKSEDDIAKIKAELELHITALTTQLETLTQHYNELLQQHKHQSHVLADSQKACQLSEELRTQEQQEAHTLRATLAATQAESTHWREQAVAAHHDLRKDFKESQDKCSRDQKNLTEHYAQELSATRILMESTRHDFMAEITNFKVAQDKLTQQLLIVREEKQQAITSLSELQKTRKEKDDQIKTLQTQNQQLLEQLDRLTRGSQAWGHALQAEQQDRAQERLLLKEEITALFKNLPQEWLSRFQDKSR